MTARHRFYVETDEYAEQAITPEQRLYRHVLLQAFIDARDGDSPSIGLRITKHLTGPGSQERQTARATARAWFRDAGRDYLAVCEAAGVCPRRTRTNVLALLGEQQALAA